MKFNVHWHRILRRKIIVQSEMSSKHVFFRIDRRSLLFFPNGLYYFRLVGGLFFLDRNIKETLSLLQQTGYKLLFSTYSRVGRGGGTKPTFAQTGGFWRVPNFYRSSPVLCQVPHRFMFN